MLMAQLFGVGVQLQLVMPWDIDERWLEVIQIYQA